MGRSRGFPRQSRSRRLTQWTAGPQTTDNILTGTGSVIWNLGITTSDPVTLIRTRGYAHVQLQTADAAGAGFVGALGIGIVSNPSFTAGVASVPTPLTDEEWEGWLWHQYFDVRAITATIANGVNGVGNNFRFEIDSKAMRVWDDETTLMGVIEVVESVNATLEFNARTRILLKN